MSVTFDEQMMQRCFDLAKKGGKETKTNPNVGAIIVHNHKIIGEGYHKAYGGDHAEVEAYKSVSIKNLPLLSQSTLYVSLEPCCFTGKTGACTNLIIKNRIPEVKISCLDPNPKVNGQGVKILEDAGVKVESGILEDQGRIIIHKFVTNNIIKRPYIILKIAESADGYIGKEGEQVWITGKASKVLSHKWRTEVDGIMIGTNTAVIDNPNLTSRLFPGDNPMRITIDRNGRIPKSHDIRSDAHPSLIFTSETNYSLNNKLIIQLDDEFDISYILNELYKNSIYSVIIEGGKQLIKSFLTANLWDECRVIRSNNRLISGIKSPLIQFKYQTSFDLENDQVHIGYNNLN